MSILELDEHLFTELATHLDPTALVSLGLTCRALHDLATHTPAWQRLCDALIADSSRPEDAFSAQGSAAAAVKDFLGYDSYKALCQTLFATGGVPTGVWYRTDAAAGPQGLLVLVTAAQRGVYAAFAVQPDGHAQRGLPLWRSDLTHTGRHPYTQMLYTMMKKRNALVVPSARHHGVDSQACSDSGSDSDDVNVPDSSAVPGVFGAPVDVDGDGLPPVHPFPLASGHRSWGTGRERDRGVSVMWPATLRISSGGATASVTSSVPRRFDMVGMRTVLQNHPPAGHTDAWWESASLDTLFHSPGSTSPDVACTLRLRRISKRPCALTRAAWQPRISAAARAIGSLRDIQDVRRELSALEGLWTSHYGPHGTEVLQCSVYDGSGEPPDSYGSAPMPWPPQAPQLRLLKLRGDPNVPACRLSIIMNLGVKGWQQVMTGRVRIAIAGSCHAQVQINEVPGRWVPEWAQARAVLVTPDAATYSGTDSAANLSPCWLVMSAWRTGQDLERVPISAMHLMWASPLFWPENELPQLAL